MRPARIAPKGSRPWGCIPMTFFKGLMFTGEGLGVRVYQLPSGVEVKSNRMSQAYLEDLKHRS